ncbi:carbohydrate ABC transporter permease [Helcobacillus massiliensis]|uniref:carbohydrate ABC transporter permease n=1 Tax=Helcobacillus massiliensis TaxID=521392 RepID=UPI0021A39053|nr:carbohydrate ABC transporter permease [Helcobacillus massiliensis]MCT1557579.1 carbohydrate ABC transporter permease [Helcobacillus massiliensis]MCT2036804.1 carbohydrate ABC transporter permease [Helcobacillus massiliensis]MCT2332443.1 carbohydrate ABC transporter permease [Helcobacillus massiliensis]
MRVSKAEVTLNYVILTVFAVIALTPILTVLATVFQHRTGGGSASKGAADGGVLATGAGNLAEAWSSGGFGRYLLTSLLVAVVVLGVSLVLSIMTGYAFGTMRFRGSTALFYLFLLGLMIPAEAIVIPLFFDLRTLGLTDTLLAVAGPQIAQSVAFGTFWMRAQFRAMPPELIDAAAVDGATSWRTLTGVLVPASKQGIATLSVLVFMWTWNEFLIPLVMSPTGAFRTAPLALSIFKGQYTAETQLLAAAAVIIALPVVIVFIILQRYFIKGMLEGGVK